jgi:hypothetical protein
MGILLGFAPIVVFATAATLCDGMIVGHSHSMATGKPFTLRYARKRLPAKRVTSPQFAKINFAITSVRALAFVCIVIADVLMAYVN